MLKLLHEIGRSVAVLDENALLFVLRYGEGWPRPHFHPIYAPHSSRVVTLHAPHDWVHHRGMMWAFGRVTPVAHPDDWVDFWNERECTRDADGRKVWPKPLPAKRRGIVRHLAFDVLQPGRECARICAQHEWRRASDDAVYFKSEMQVTAFPSRDDGWYFDLELSLHAHEAMRLENEATLEDPCLEDNDYGGVPFGLACQFARELGGGVLLNSQGCRADACVHGPARWCDFSNPVDDNDTELHAEDTGIRWVGAAILDHPDNPAHPTPFFALKRDAFLSAAPLSGGPLTIEADETVRWKYRVFVHDGRGDAARLDALWNEFTQ
ncbi:MAG TPA: DUF6807 family protein [Abditibacteriaceae bacterium]|jgi:hypothetical protein